jgi:hypothetical protein
MLGSIFIIKYNEGFVESLNCSVKILKKLYNDKDINVRCGIAENPNCPTEILDGL